jgi:hypothetical protein
VIAKPFYGRPKVRLCDLRGIRAEMAFAYRACVRQELEWQDLRAAIAALSAMADIDQGLGAAQRLTEIETRLALVKTNGSAGRPEARR